MKVTEYSPVTRLFSPIINDGFTNSIRMKLEAIKMASRTSRANSVTGIPPFATPAKRTYPCS